MKLLDFCASIRFSANAAQLAQIQQVFKDGNKILADATDGKYRFGKIHLVNNGGGSREAEIWIHPGAGRAHATLGNYGIPGAHVNVYYPNNFAAMPNANGDAYTMAHEFMHQVWGVADEYSGPAGPMNGDCEPPPGNAAANFCLMDNYFKRGGNLGSVPPGTGAYTLNELCIGANHDPDHDTFQHLLWMTSCWQRLAAHARRPVAAPAGLPEAAPPAVIPDPTFELPATDRRFVTCLDRSGSMTAVEAFGLTRLDYAKRAADLFIMLTKVNDRLGVTSFSTDSAVNFALTTILGPAERAAASAAVNALAPGGWTAIGKGLIQSRDLLLGAPDPSCAQTILLLTDGYGNVPPSELDVIPSLIANDIPVIAVAIGAEPSLPNLLQVALATGGRLYWVSTAGDLPPLFAALAAESRGAGVLARAPGLFAAAAAGASQSFPVAVDAATGAATFVITWPDPGDDLDLSLESPGGAIITPADAGINPDVEAVLLPGAESITVHVPTLKPGEWTAIVTVNAPSGPVDFDFQAFSDADDISLTVATDKSEYVLPEPITVTAILTYQGVPVVGAAIAGLVFRPDGSSVPIVLADDGDILEGDVAAGDGTSSAVFDAFAGTGAYSFALGAMNEGGVTYEGEAIFADIDAPAVSDPVPPLVRLGDAFVVVGPPPPPPPADDCAAAAAIGTGTTPFSTLNATLDGPAHGECAFAGDGQLDPDVWFAYTPPCSGELSVSLCSTADFDTRLAVYDGCDCDSLDENLMACNDDADECEALTSVVVTDALAGHCYLIRIGGTQGAQGSGLLNLSFARNCPWDLDRSGDVGIADFVLLLDAWGFNPASCADADGNGTVDIVDFLGLLASWGRCP